MQTQTRETPHSDKLERLPKVLRAYSRDADQYRVPDSDLGHQLRFAADSIDELREILFSVKQETTRDSLPSWERIHNLLVGTSEP